MQKYFTSNSLNTRIVVVCVNKMFKYVHMKNKYQMKYGEMQSAVISVLREVRLENFSEKLQIKVLKFIVEFLHHETRASKSRGQGKGPRP